jgi:hypothetical protein
VSLSDEIKSSIPILAEFERDGHEMRRARSEFVCLCPFHEERTPSCFVNPETGRFKCFGACGASGTVIDYHALKHGVAPADAIKELASRLGAALNYAAKSEHATTKPPSRKVDEPRALPRLPDLRTGTAEELQALAVCRNISTDAAQLASDRGLVRFCDLADGDERVATWVLTDRTRRNAQARRLDGDRWRHRWNGDTKEWVLNPPEQRSKVRGFFGNQAAWPVGLEESESFASIAIVEGVDLLAACHFMFAEEREAHVAPVAILGASNRIPPDALHYFSGKRVRIFPHVDANHAGLNAAANWEAQLLPVAAAIDAFDLSGLIRADGAAVKDLNDVTTIDPDCFEAERAVWSLMNF